MLNCGVRLRYGISHHEVCLDSNRCTTDARPNNRAPHKLGMEIILGARPVRGTVPRLNENCISGFPESV